MPKISRNRMIIRRLETAKRIFRVNTQELRDKVLRQLRELFDLAHGQARNKKLDLQQKEKWVRVAAYTAQVIEGVARGFDECRFNEDLAKLEKLINEAQRIGKRTAEPTAKPEGNTDSQGSG